MQIKDTKSTFGYLSIVLHWYVGITVIFLLVSGLLTQFIGPHGALRPFREDLTWWHMSIGVMSVPVYLYRTFFRLRHGEPKTLEQHWTLEMTSNTVWRLLLFIIVWQIFSGVGYELTHGNPVHMFGIVLIEPALPFWAEPLYDYLLRAHNWPAYFMVALLFLHIGGVLKHFFIDRDQVLQGMFWPGGSKPKPDNN